MEDSKKKKKKNNYQKKNNKKTPSIKNTNVKKNNKNNIKRKTNNNYSNKKKSTKKTVTKKVEEQKVQKIEEQKEEKIEQKVEEPKVEKIEPVKHIEEAVPIKKTRKTKEEIVPAEPIKKKRKVSEDAKVIEKKETKKEEVKKEVKQKPKQEKKTKISKGKVVVRIMMAFLILILLFIGSFIVDNEVKKYQEKKILEEKETIVLSIKNHYNHYVKVINDTKLYHLNNQGEYIEYGKVYKDTEVILDDISIDYLTKYFYSSDLDGYLAYDDLLPIDEISSYDDRYKRYLVFNNNVVTNDEFTLYDEDKPVYTFLESMSFPIIIKDYENRYYVEYNNRLLAIKKEDVKEIINHDNTTGKNMKSITTLCYHRVYDTTEKCTDPYVCIKKASFDKEMKYLKDNGYLTLSMKELYWYLTGKIQVSKAVTITFDDGYLYKSAEDVLAKYDLNGTIFVISSYFDDIDTYKNLKHLDLQSHTHNMHRNYVCSGGTQGGAILCASEQTIKEDLEKSLAKLDVEPWGLAFPFYDHNDKAIKVVKEVGFKMSFIGRAGVMGKAYPNKTYLYKIPRMTVWDESIMNFNTWKSYL